MSGQDAPEHETTDTSSPVPESPASDDPKTAGGVNIDNLGLNVDDLPLVAVRDAVNRESASRGDVFQPYPAERLFRLKKFSLDRARFKIAIILVCLLVGFVVSVMAIVICCPTRKPFVVEILKTLFPPIVALVSSVVGFYFGGAGKGNS